MALDRFFRLLLFNYIYGNGDAHLKNFSIINTGEENSLAPAYDLLNTALHIDGDDMGLRDGLFRDGRKSDTFERTGHPCRTDFETFGQHIGLTPRRVEASIAAFSTLPTLAVELVERSFLDKKMKRRFLAIVNERLLRFGRRD